MTRGGKRTPVGGRPKAEGETKTTNLCGVRVTPTQLAAYKKAAADANMTLSQWATYHLDYLARGLCDDE